MCLWGCAGRTEQEKLRRKHEEEQELARIKRFVPRCLWRQPRVVSVTYDDAAVEIASETEELDGKAAGEAAAPHDRRSRGDAPPSAPQAVRRRARVRRHLLVFLCIILPPTALAACAVVGYVRLAALHFISFPCVAFRCITLQQASHAHNSRGHDVDGGGAGAPAAAAFGRGRRVYGDDDDDAAGDARWGGGGGGGPPAVGHGSALDADAGALARQQYDEFARYVTAAGPADRGGGVSPATLERIRLEQDFLKQQVIEQVRYTLSVLKPCIHGRCAGEWHQ